MNEKNKLLKQLAEIESKENELKTDLNKAKEKLEGKIFSRIYTNGKNKNVNYTYYWGFVIKSGGYIECDVREISLYFTSLSSRCKESGIRRSRNYKTFYDFNREYYDIISRGKEISLEEFEKYFNREYYDIISRGKEISLEEFEKYWNYVGEKARISIESFITENVPLVPEYEEQKDAELDLPYWNIPTNLTHYISKSVFYVGQNHLLKSVKSKDYVLKVIRDSREQDRKLAHLYEKCDRHYVEMTRENMNQLESIVSS